MDVFEAIVSRRAVRDYLPTPIDRTRIETLIETACHAPSAMNRQPWGYVVVDDPAMIDESAAAVKSFVLQHLPPELVARYRAVLESPDYHILHRAPALIIVCATEPDISSAVFAAEDCCLAAQTLMIAAHAQGLGTCWIGFARPWLGLAESKQLLGIPPAWSPVAPIVVGTPRTTPEAVERRPPKIVWHGGQA